MPNSQLFSSLEGFHCPTFKPHKWGTCMYLSSSSKHLPDSDLVQEQNWRLILLNFRVRICYKILKMILSSSLHNLYVRSWSVMPYYGFGVACYLKTNIIPSDKWYSCVHTSLRIVSTIGKIWMCSVAVYRNINWTNNLDVTTYMIYKMHNIPIKTQRIVLSV